MNSIKRKNEGKSPISEFKLIECEDEQVQVRRNVCFLGEVTFKEPLATCNKTLQI